MNKILYGLAALVLPVLALAVVLLPASAQAQSAPQCYIVVQGRGQTASCTDDNIQAYLRARGETLQPGKCYVAAVDAVGFEVYDSASPACFRYASEAQESAGQEQAANQTQVQQSLDNPQRLDCNDEDSCVKNNPLIKTIVVGVNFLSGLVVVVVIIVVVIAGIQYSAAGGNPNATAAAKARILNAMIALVAYLVLFMFFQWLIPGGLF